MFETSLFADKYRLALETALQEKPQSGLCGFELEWNLLDSHFRPLLWVGSGPSQQSFIDYLRSESLSPWVRDQSQLEVFHWMIEWATRPYFHPHGAVYEGWLMEGVLLNALSKASRNFDEQLYSWHGNLLYSTSLWITNRSPVRGILPSAAIWNAASIYMAISWQPPVRTPTYLCRTRCWHGISCTNRHLHEWIPTWTTIRASSISPLRA